MVCPYTNTNATSVVKHRKYCTRVCRLLNPSSAPIVAARIWRVLFRRQTCLWEERRIKGLPAAVETKDAARRPALLITFADGINRIAGAIANRLISGEEFVDEDSYSSAGW
jgi:hypothetical protein